MATRSNVKVYQPSSLDELDKIVHKTKDKLTFLAGATDLMAQEQHWNKADRIVNLLSVDEITKKIEVQEIGLLVGAAVPMTELMAHPVVIERFPMLVEACRLIGSVQIQNRATLGGNIANASPAGDTLPVLNVLDAYVYVGPKNQDEFEQHRFDEIMLGPGQTILDNNRYIAFIFLPYYESGDSFWYFRKVGQRYALAISKLSLAVLGRKKDNRLSDIRICAGSVAPQVKRTFKTEKILEGQTLNKQIIEEAHSMIMTEVAPITDIRSESGYRKHMCGELLREALHQIV